MLHVRMANDYAKILNLNFNQFQTFHQPGEILTGVAHRLVRSRCSELNVFFLSITSIKYAELLLFLRSMLLNPAYFGKFFSRSQKSFTSHLQQLNNIPSFQIHTHQQSSSSNIKYTPRPGRYCTPNLLMRFTNSFVFDSHLTLIPVKQ